MRFILLSNCTKKPSDFVQNKKKRKKVKKFFKRVFTKPILYGKLWEKLNGGKVVFIIFPITEQRVTVVDITTR